MNRLILCLQLIVCIVVWRLVMGLGSIVYFVFNQPFPQEIYDHDEELSRLFAQCWGLL